MRTAHSGMMQKLHGMVAAFGNFDIGKKLWRQSDRGVANRNEGGARGYIKYRRGWSVFAALRRAKGWRMEDGIAIQRRFWFLPNLLVPRSDSSVLGVRAHTRPFHILPNRRAFWPFRPSTLASRLSIRPHCAPARLACRPILTETCATLGHAHERVHCPAGARQFIADRLRRDSRNDQLWPRFCSCADLRRILKLASTRLLLRGVNNEQC